MKYTFIKIAVLTSFTCGLFITQSCKKEDQLSGPLEKTTKSGILSISELTASNMVSTVAGVPNSPGFADGTARTAHFNTPLGIQMITDGTLYIADKNNNAIRKLTSDGNVTTLNLKAPENFPVQGPTSVGIDNAGSVHILSYLVDQAGLSYIFDKNGVFVAGDGNTYTGLGALAKDPYEDFFWFSEYVIIEKHIANTNGSTGRDIVPFNSSLLNSNERGRGSSFRGLFVGRNKVIYFATDSRIFKYTPGGVTAQLYPDFKFKRITSLVLNADSRSMYLASEGQIFKIENGKLTLLARPNSATPDGRDGVGLKADVHAFSLALGDHENSLYFSDNVTNTIRKIMLK
ncbi:hypothetical protein A0256_03335 [Mucilaginibacter sp. PAMC 26640]|nr:hypothetical protein A0256_03335 [Mucilaginibacter sp. PAMC 26640]